MREWTVEGVDEAGAARKVRVKAQDEGVASTLATQRGVRPPHAVQPLNYATPVSIAPAAAENAATHSDEVTEVARRLRLADRVLNFAGRLAILCAALWFIAAVVQTGSGRGIPLALVIAAGVSVAGMLVIGLGAGLRMLAVIGERAALVQR